MATLHPSSHAKPKKASSKTKSDAETTTTHVILVKPLDTASFKLKTIDVGAVVKGTIRFEAIKKLKVSLTTFRADDQLEELIKSNNRFVEAHQRHLLDFQDVYSSSMFSLVEATKAGVSPKMLSLLSSEMGMPKEGMADRLGLASSTVRNKTATSKLLSTDDSEKVIGMSRLIGQVQAMVNDAGNPEGFDAAAWLANWMEQGLPALGGRKPSEYMDTAVGQALVSQLLDQIRSGAYA